MGSLSTNKMKLAYIAAALVSTSITAQEEPGERKFSHVIKMIQASGLKTKFSDAEMIKRIQNYGCHCFPGMSRIAGGAGPPQDDYDALCRDLARCQQCVSLEFNVDPATHKYIFNYIPDKKIFDCSDNKTPAKEALCQCNADYALKLADIWRDEKFNVKIWNNKKNADFNFDHENVCEGLHNHSPDQCCGEKFPDKVPFDSSNRQCCKGTKTFNPSVQECCQDGSVASPG